jgi:hypothetical protein
LHRPLWRKLTKRLYVKGKRIGPVEVALFLVASLVICYYVNKLVQPPGPTPPPISTEE